MFELDWGKLVIIGIVALIAIGPKELPTVLRTLGQYMAKIRRMAAEFQGQFQEAMREAEMAELKSRPKISRARSATLPVSIRWPRRRRRSSALSRCRKWETWSKARPRPRPPHRQLCLSRSSSQRSMCRCGSRRTQSATKILRRSKRHRKNRPGAADDSRGYRGHKGAADRSPDRIAFPTDQGADRFRGDVCGLLRVRQE